MTDSSSAVARSLGPRALGALSGVMLTVPHLYPAAAPLHLVALVPILWVLMSPQVSTRLALSAGVYMGLFYALPQLVILRMPPMVVAVLLPDLMLLIILFAAGSMLLLRRWPVLGAIGAAALLGALDWLNFTFVPIWGIAQSLARPWSSYPGLIGFVSFTGLTGVLFALTCLQALALRVAIDPRRRGRAIVAAAGVLALAAGGNVATRCGEPTGTITVAAVGWTEDDAKEADRGDGADGIEGFRALYADRVTEAARRGARLVVSPEKAFLFIGGPRHRDRWLSRFRTVARQNDVFLAVGYHDFSDNANRLLFMAPDGTVLETYTKTHLTPFEDTQPGTGRVAVTDILGHRVGGMICHDDNYTSLTRAHGRRKTALMAVPTLDWAAIKSAHFQSSINRAIESRYAIVRAARNGISAIISPDGRVLARRDHFEDGPGIVVANVALHPKRTFFSIAGHCPAMAGAAFVAGCFGVMIAQALRRPIPALRHSAPQRHLAPREHTGGPPSRTYT